MPDAARGVDRLAVDLAHADVGVGEDRRDRQQRQHGDDVREAEAEERDEERQQRERRHRAADVRHRDREELAAADVAEPQRRAGRRATAAIAIAAIETRMWLAREVRAARRARRCSTPPEIDSRSEKMKSNASPKAPRMASGAGRHAPRPPPRAGSRCAARMSRSPTAASRTASPPATTTLDLKKTAGRRE